MRSQRDLTSLYRKRTKPAGKLHVGCYVTRVRGADVDQWAVAVFGELDFFQRLVAGRVGVSVGVAQRNTHIDGGGHQAP